MRHLVKSIARKIFPRFQPQPEHPWPGLAQSAWRAEPPEPLLFLSFDCDSDLDIPAADALAYRLRDRGIRSTFAVPGAQLIKGAEVFRRMADDGFEFINHGASPHTEWDGHKYIPITFYDRMPLAEVAADIREGDRLAREVTGKAPRGFRAPHFGSFQSLEQIDFMHGLCKELGYIYASTTMPAIGMERGAAFMNSGIVELPLTGSWREPLNIPDSWSKLTDRVNFTLGDDFSLLWEESLEAARAGNLPMLFCWYVDPAHVIDQQPFKRAIDAIARSGIRSVTGTECAKLFCENAVEGVM
ncbi:MAG: polysaccharide deacetylase family protein [Desulfovibrionaceae bacterium]|nr:polysaccharide deacetylase family protein [Desulfovibrionaceae bacterium]